MLYAERFFRILPCLLFSAVCAMLVLGCGQTRQQPLEKMREDKMAKTAAPVEQREIARPPVDTEQPARLERATFALG